MTKMCVFFCCGIVECVGKQFKVAELKKRNLNSLKKHFNKQMSHNFLWKHDYGNFFSVNCDKLLIKTNNWENLNKNVLFLYWN